MYARLGLAPVGIRKGYYGDDDALILWAHDIDGEGYREEAALKPLILAFETSCDETAVAVVQGTEALSNVLASQVDLHSRFGGVVPEVAARAHVESIRALTHQALNEAGIHPADLDGVGATAGPGLVGALLVGHSLRQGHGLGPPAPIRRHRPHGRAPDGAAAPIQGITRPWSSLLASGGHTQIVHVSEWGEYRVMGSTIDDAAGEAFDKLARVMGLGFPGAPPSMLHRRVAMRRRSSSPGRFPTGLSISRSQG